MGFACAVIYCFVFVTLILSDCFVDGLCPSCWPLPPNKKQKQNYNKNLIFFILTIQHLFFVVGVSEGGRGVGRCPFLKVLLTSWGGGAGREGVDRCPFLKALLMSCGDCVTGGGSGGHHDTQQPTVLCPAGPLRLHRTTPAGSEETGQGEAPCWSLEIKQSLVLGFYHPIRPLQGCLRSKRWRGGGGA